MANSPDARDPETLLRRTRKAVLDVLVVAAVGIAISGWLIRRRSEQVLPPASRLLHDGLFVGLAVTFVGSYLARRTGLRARGLPADRAAVRFYRSHVLSAAIAAVGIPIGLAYGWFVEPHLEAVAPFWVLPMGLGALAFPRRGELAEFLGGDDAPPPRPPEAPGP